MKKLFSILGYKTKYRIKTVKVGVRERYQIQKSVLGLMWDTVINPLIVSPASPYEFKMYSDAEKKKAQLETTSA